MNLLAWLCLSAGLFPAYAGPEDALDPVSRKFYEQATTAESAGKRAEAESLYRLLHEQDPSFIPASMGLGRALEAQGKTSDAEALYRSLDMDADAVEALARLVAPRAPEEALGLYRQLESLRLGDPLPFCAETRLLAVVAASNAAGQGSAALGAGALGGADDARGKRILEAQSTWERCVTLSDGAQPDLSVLLVLLDALLPAAPESEFETMATALLQEALTRWPTATEAPELRAQLDRLEVERSARGVVLGGAEPLTGADLGLLKQARGWLATDPMRARAVSESLLERAPRSAEAHGALADATFGTDWTTSEIHAVRARDLDPDDAANHLRVARVLHAAYGGRRDAEAAVAMRQAVALRPDEPEMLLQVADLECSQGEWQRASAALERWLQINPDPTLAVGVEARLEALMRAPPVVPPLGSTPSGAGTSLAGVSDAAASAWRVALVYLDRGERAAARTELDRALALAPGVPALLNVDARLRRESGDVPGAVRAWQQSLDRDPQQGDVQLALGQTLEVNGDGEGALAHYRAAAEVGEVDAHYFLARSALAVGDWSTVDVELAAFNAAGGQSTQSSLYAVAAQHLSEQARAHAWNVRGAAISFALFGVGVPALVVLRRRSGSDLRQMLDAAPTSWHDAARILAAIRHEVLKHNTTVLPDIANALDRGDRASWDAWRPGAADLLARFDGYVAALILLGEHHGVRLVAHRDPVLAPMRSALGSLVRASKRSRAPRATDLRAHSNALNGQGYTALGTLVTEICILAITPALIQSVYNRVAAEPGFNGAGLPPVAFSIRGPGGQVRLFRGDIEDILANLFRNALAAGAHVIDVVLGDDSDPITGHTWFEIRVEDDAPGQLSTAMIRSRYISRGLGLAVDLLNRHGGTIRVESAPASEGGINAPRKAVVVQLPAVEAAPVEVEW